MFYVEGFVCSTRFKPVEGKASHGESCKGRGSQHIKVWTSLYKEDENEKPFKYNRSPSRDNNFKKG